MSNRKAQAQIRVDWLTLVYKAINPDFIKMVIDDLELKEFYHHWEKMSNPINQYDECYALANATIILGFKYVRYNGVLDKKAPSEMMIQFSGRGLASYGEDCDNVYQKLVVDQIEKYQVSISRIDVAVDFLNYDYHFSPAYLYDETVYGHNLITRSKTIKYINTVSSKGASHGRSHADIKKHASREESTLYIGKNPKQLRIYNKLMERKRKYDVDYSKSVNSWYRWEYQLNGVKADEFILELKKQHYDLKQTWINYLSCDIRFIKHVGHQEKRTRYPNAKWFAELISEANTNKIESCRDYSLPTLEQSVDWLQHGGAMKRILTIIENQKKNYAKLGLSDDDVNKLAYQCTLSILSNLDGKVKEPIDKKLLDFWRNNDSTLVNNFLSEKIKKGDNQNANQRQKTDA